MIQKELYRTKWKIFIKKNRRGGILDCSLIEWSVCVTNVIQVVNTLVCNEMQ